MKHYAQSVSAMDHHEVRSHSVFDRKGNRKYLNHKERQRFHQTAYRLNDEHKKTFCLTLFYTGCRISEALNLHAENLDRSEKQIVFKTLKQKGEVRYRAVPIPQELLLLLPMVKENRRIWNFSRVTGWRIIKKCMKEAGLDGTKATPKGLRHSFAVACITQNIPITVVQRWLGHANLKNTAIYLDVGGAEDRRFAKRIWHS